MTVPNRCIWIASYADGHEIQEQGDAYKHLVRKDLIEFKLVDEQNKTIVSIKPQPNEVLFYRRRDIINIMGRHVCALFLLGTRKRLPDNTIQTRIFIVLNDRVIDNQFRNEWFEPDWNQFPEEQV